MKNNLHILIVEDNKYDVELLLESLRKIDIDFTYNIIDNEAGFNKALINEKPDLVLSDYTLPQFDGLTALKKAKDKYPDLPFIFISGTIGELKAVETLRAGATDYVLKDQIIKIGPVINRVLREIEDKKAKTYAQEMLKKSEERYKNLVENINDVIVTLDVNGTITYISPVVNKYLGYKPEELTGKDFAQFIHRDDVDFVKDHFKKLTFGEVSPISFKVVSKQGIAKYFDASSRPIYEGSKIVGVTSRITDVTEQQKVEERLEFQANIINLIEQAVVAFSDKDEIIYWNRAAERLFGISDLDALGESLAMINESGNVPEGFFKMKENLKDDVNWKGELEIENGNERITSYVTGSPIKNKEGKINGSIAVATDITKIKTIQKELQIAMEEAKEANRLKSGFLSAMSHEIRTPLNIILGYSELLRDTLQASNDTEIELYLENINLASKRLLNTIIKVLDISRIESGEFPVNKKEVSVHKVITAVYSEYYQKNKEKNISVELELPADELWVKADEYCLESAIKNVVDNAFKYSNEGKVLLKVKQEGNSIICYVKDEGIGMSAEYQKHLFETFSQEEYGFTRSYEGIGLGLALTKRYIDLMNGNIEVESKKGEGTLVKMKLPI